MLKLHRDLFFKDKQINQQSPFAYFICHLRFNSALLQPAFLRSRCLTNIHPATLPLFDSQPRKIFYPISYIRDSHCKERKRLGQVAWIQVGGAIFTHAWDSL